MARYYSGQTQPLGSWNNLPIYLTTIVTAALVVGFIGVAILASLGAGGQLIIEQLIFVMPLQPGWTAWRLVTYLFVNQLNFFTPFGIYCFYWWSNGMETHLGRPRLTALFGLLAAVPVVFGAVIWWGLGLPIEVFGFDLFLAGLLVAFATLYPNSEAWGWIPFKWMAAACIFCGSLMLFPHHEWLRLAELWTSCLVGFFYMRFAKEQEFDDYVSPFARLKELVRRKPKLRVLPTPQMPRRQSVANEPPSDLDVILDKISKSGMDSLTPKERSQLQKAREALIRKEQR